LRPTVLITGAYGFIGGAVTARIVDRAEVRSLTGQTPTAGFADRVRSFAYDFETPERMADAFQGADVLVNSYYVRFNYGATGFELAVERSRTLLALARAARVRKIVHVSVSNADEDSNLPYYRNKGRVERFVRQSGIEYTILRPAIVAGTGDTLINNIAFFLRRLPVFTVFGRGTYRVQPMTLDAFTEIVVEAVDGAYPNETLAVAGPADWTFIELVRAIREAIGSRAAIVRAPAWMALAGVKVAGLVLRDVVLTADEVKGLTREYLCSPQPLRRGADFDVWLASESVAGTLGRAYASELARHFRRRQPR
jgi:uncharacterized protein YbjT (DUF2867 family)